MNVSYQDQMALLQEKRRELRALEAQAERTARAMSPLTIEDEHRMVAMQARADSLYRGAGRLPAPLAEPHERPGQYERRLVDGLKVYSDRWAKASLERMPDDAFAIARDQIFADAAQNAKTHGLASTEIREVPSVSAAGHRTIEFVGGPDAHFTQQFCRPPRRVLLKSQEEYSQMTRDAQLSRITEMVRYGQRPTVQAPRAAF
jgi:hypothetical protein